MTTISTPPATMWAMARQRYGGPDSLEWCELPTPQPGKGEVLVRVLAAGLDQGAHHVMTGKPHVARLAFGLRRPRQATFGTEVAGVIAAVGDGGCDLAVGDRVFGTTLGAFAEYVVAKPARLSHMPAHWAPATGAALGVSSTTALQGLRDLGRVGRGDRVLILGASGGVGSFAVQMALVMGADVTAVCSGRKRAAVAALGAHRVLDYRVDDVASAGRHDVVVDIGGNRSVRALRRLLTMRGRLVMIGAEVTGVLGIGRQLRASALSPFVRQRLMMLVAKDRRSDLDVVKEMVEAGTVHPVVDRVMPLRDLADAMHALEAGEVTGKIVLAVADED